MVKKVGGDDEMNYEMKYGCVCMKELSLSWPWVHLDFKPFST